MAYSMPRGIAMIGLVLALAGCSTVVESNPSSTAMEQLLISAAANRAAERIDFHIPKGTPVFVDTSDITGNDARYADAAIRDSLLRQGARLAGNRKSASMIVMLRDGALSTDRKDMLVGVPSFSVPIPFSSAPLVAPKLALYQDADQEGVAKFSATVYDAKTGSLVASSRPAFGFSHNRKYTFLLFISWRANDVLPLNQQGGPKPRRGKPQPSASSRS